MEIGHFADSDEREYQAALELRRRRIPDVCGHARRSGSGTRHIHHGLARELREGSGLASGVLYGLPAQGIGDSGSEEKGE